jgi:preprotein translocase subunit SecF
VNTSLTVIIVLIAVVIWGGESVRWFAVALLVGVGFGTYSSIFVASALLVSRFKMKFSGKTNV